MDDNYGTMAKDHSKKIQCGVFIFCNSFFGAIMYLFIIYTW